MAELARDEEAWWQAEVARMGPQIVMPGRPVRGGGRAAGDGLAPSLAIDVTRLAALAVALQRRLLRYAADELGAAVDFPATEALRALALRGRAGQKLELAQGLLAERTHREVRLTVLTAAPAGSATAEAAPEYTVGIPDEVTATAFGLRLRIQLSEPSSAAVGHSATLRNWRAGDRVRLRYSSGPRKVKEVLERLRVTGSSRARWPVLELDGRIVWMRGVEVEPEPGIRIEAASLTDDGPLPMGRSTEG
jgi:tRNA(Ile)-lysidine synthase